MPENLTPEPPAGQQPLRPNEPAKSWRRRFWASALLMPAFIVLVKTYGEWVMPGTVPRYLYEGLVAFGLLGTGIVSSVLCFFKPDLRWWKRPFLALLVAFVYLVLCVLFGTTSSCYIRPSTLGGPLSPEQIAQVAAGESCG